MHRTSASQLAVEERVEKAEEMLCAGIAPGRVERSLAKDYGVTPRQARKYIGRVYDRWRVQSREDGPLRREKLIRMAERFYAKCLSEKQFSAASSVLVLLGRMSGAFSQHDPARDQRMAALGAPPDDPTLALVWAQKCMVLALHEVVTNAALDPERRLRWIAELGGKLGMTHAKTVMEQKLDDVESRLLGGGERTNASTDLEPTTGLAFPTHSRARRGDA